MFKQSVLGDEPQVPVDAPLMSPVLNSELDIAPAKVRYSAMDDVDSLRTNIFEKIKGTVASKFPIENTRYRLELHDVGYDSDKPATKEEQKRALLRQTSVSRKLRGTWKMLDKATGATVDQQHMVLAHVPYLTERGTFIKNGNEYAVASQSRLKAGAYNRRRNSGEAETHFNILEGGRGFHLVMDPATKQFTVRVGGAKLKLFPVLKELGLTDKDIQTAWGTELYNDNIAADDSAKRALKQFGNDTDTDLLSVFSRMKLDPEVVSHTLGKPYTNVTPEVIMAATKRLINISRGTESEDDRDSIAFQKIMSPDDLFAERVALDYDKHTRNMLWKSTNKGRIAADSGHFTKQIDTIFTKSGLAQALEETNPVETLDQQYKVLRTGEAGISSDGVPMESRNVQGSHLGIVDPIRGPECYADDMEVFTSDGWIPWKTADFSTEFACLVDGNMVFAAPFNVVHERYDGPMYGILTKYIDHLVTPNHRMWCKYVHGCNESYRFNYAENVYGGRRKFMCGGHGPYIGDSVTDEFTLPDVTAGSNSQKTFGPIPMRLWAAFMGWYLSEGSTHINTSRSYYAVRISQLKEPQCSTIRSLLEQLPFSFSYSKSEGGFTITGKQLAVYLDQFGYAQDKYIPGYLLHADVESRRALLQALLDGDGRSVGRKQDFRVTSPLLARDFQFLAISLGYSTNVGFEKDEREPQYFGCHRVSLHHQNEREVAALSGGKQQHYKVAYSGTVHCATVPGGLLYVRRGRGIGMWSGNSGNVGLDARFSINTRRGSDGRVYTLMLGQDGNPVHVSAQKAATSTVAFPGEFDTTSRRVRVMTPGGDIRYVDRKSVDFWMRSPTHMFTVGSNLVPMISATLGPRLLMGGKFYNQALPVQNPEAPLVQALSDDGEKSFEELYGTKAGAIRSTSSGRVVKVEPGFVHIQTPKGIEKVELYNNFPFNRKTFIHNTPVVQPGDHVKAGDLLAYSNATDKQGTLALGKNLSVAYMPWKGLNTDDAVVISEAAAHKMASEHMFTKKIDSENAIQRDRKGFIALYPGKYVKEQLANMGDDGVIMPGSIVQKGDPLILAVKERRVSDIHRGQKPGFSDVSEEWDHEAPGQVTDVEQTSKGVRLSIKAYKPMQIGDKLCYDNDTEVLTTSGWKYFRDVTLQDEVATLVDNSELVYVRPTRLTTHHYTGKMYSIQSQQVDFCVTPDHDQFVRKRDAAEFTLVPASRIFGKRVEYKKNASWTGYRRSHVTIDPCTVVAGQHGHGVRVLPEVQLKTEVYLMLLGAFISEGNIVNHEPSGTYGLDICQVKEPNRSQLEAALTAAGIKFCRTGDKLRVHSKQLMLHFSKLGTSASVKRLPDHVFSLSSEQLTVLFRWMMWGDGHTHKSGRPVTYYTTSQRLADDMQRLCLHIGWAANISVRCPEGGVIKGAYYDFKPCYCVSIVSKKCTPTVNHGHVKTQRVQREAWVDYDSSVWCCTVPVGHVIYVRRGGKPAWSGNCGRFGDKGVISEIVRDGEMPTDSEGNPLDVILNPMGVVTRTNPSQLVETVLGKIAAKTGKPYKIPAFTKESYIEYAIREAEKNGVSDTDTLSDPASNRKFNNIMTGKRFFMKLHHMSEDKEDAHGVGGYTAEDQPVRGSGGAKQIGMLSIGAYLSHGATEVLRDSKTIRGQKNNDFWKAFQQGYAPPSPEVPLVYKKFRALLTGAGINIDKKGHQEHLMALTDKDVLSMSAGEISSPKGVNIDDMSELDGGLFDRRITGGHNGKRWSHIKLTEPVPNPVMEEPIRRFLGLTGDQFEAVLSGKQELHGRTGGEAILEGLRRLDLKAMRRSQEEIIRSGAKSKRDNAIKLLHYIDGIQKSGIEPTEMVMSTVPVLPPVFRPISSTEKFTIVSDANRLYVDLMKSNEALNEVKSALGEKHAGDERLNLYNSFKAVTGLGDPISPQLRQQNVRGLLGQVFGSGSPKFGMFQRRVLGGAVDFSGRAVISPNPSLDMDTVGLPEDQAWELYRPALMRRMTIRGMPATVAAKSILDKTDVARQSLIEEMRERPIIINRAPTLHRYNMMAMFPQLVKGHTLQISPIVASGFNADYDGDAMQIYVPVSKKAVEEAASKMLPSRNLFSASRFAAHYLPSQEFQHGLWLASAKQSKKDVETFATLEDAIAAYKNGDLDVTDRIRILGIPVKDRRPE